MPFWTIVRAPKAYSSGFSLVEALISLTLIGVLASLTIPMLRNQEERHRLIDPIIGTASELSSSYTAYLRGNVRDTTITSTQIVAGLNNVRNITDGTTTIQVQDDAVVPGPRTLTCSGANPCIVLHSGAYLYYDPTATFGDTTNAQTYDNAIWFVVDPDGPDIQPGVVLVMYYTGRITPLQQSNPTSANPADPAPQFTVALPVQNTTDDPDYLNPWVTGNY